MRMMHLSAYHNDEKKTYASGFCLCPELTRSHNSLYPNPKEEESWTLKSADNPESSGKTTISAHIPGPRGIHLELSGQRNLGAVRERGSLQSLPAPRAESQSPRALTHLRAEVRTPLLL